MKKLFALICMFALVFPMELEINQLTVGYYEYSVKELNAVNTSLQVVVLKEGKQYYVEDIAGYNGLHRGKLTLREPGRYMVTAFNTQTGESAEAGVVVAAPAISQEAQQEFEAEQQKQAEEYLEIPAQEIVPGLPFIVVGLFVVLVALILFGNPLKKK